MNSLRIGVNALYLLPGEVGGTEIYLRSLLAALAAVDSGDRYVVFTNRETGPDLVPGAANFEHAPQGVRARNRPARLLWEQLVLPREVKRRQIDVLFNAGFTSPVLPFCRTVSVFHDLQHKRHPEHFRWFDLPFWNIFLYASALRSSRIIAVSEATRADLIEFYRLPESKITVVPHGVDERMFEIGRERDGRRPERYFLCVSTLHPHKNIERLVRAFYAFRREEPGFRLVLAGKRGFDADRIENLIAELRLQEAVVVTGWIPREDLYRWYRDAWAFVYPSTFEGFGMPVLEALAGGIPTACSAIEPLKSLSGGAALLFDPGSTEGVLEALRRLAADEALRSELASAGPARAAQFSWREAARRTLAVLTGE